MTRDRFNGIGSFFATFLLVLVGVTGAGATTISSNLTADNLFFAYISTNDAVLGTQISSGSDWTTAWSFSGVSLTPGVTNYLHIEAINQGGPAAFLGDFTLSDNGFHFVNGGQTIATGTQGWTGIYNNNNSNFVPQPWVQPTGGGVDDFGPNGTGIWAAVLGGPVGGISTNAHWIWPNDANSSGCGSCTVDMTLAIYPSTPEPGSLLLFGSGVVGLAGIVRRKLTL